MWRKTVCAGSGIILACAAIYGLSSLDTRSTAANFDLRWLYPASKADRLPLVQLRSINVDNVVMAFNVPSASTTIAARGPTLIGTEWYRSKNGQNAPVARSVQASPVRVRTIPVNPVRTVPLNEKPDTKDAKDKDKLPVGCEPAFSPVTTPSMAHISSRCDA
ncbi:hypothetical protein [Pseudorhodoplanes sinuspersici]|uniref:Uncharacterized protein n=1 Tax=Pseudorhodoplanes sinuspersici TaxID=1235591 RepID=A0A1W6ZQ93_9HYPH|nr:hypothetical protein [Pseudorhodoplanes sinuspersici]ARP99566.1 hypothetical protein CAK95_11080 [Pseudorhodoplanes sinuspersici]RKE70534.1 hypothetical protein DFP91_2766 [Pseudorhodoplanes sinuspersici]